MMFYTIDLVKGYRSGVGFFKSSIGLLDRESFKRAFSFNGSNF